MFSRKKPPAIQVTKLSSLIADDVVITGDVTFTNGLRIDGRIKGHVISMPSEGQARGLLVLSEKGCVEGSVSSGDAVVNGTVTGDLNVEHFLELQANARVSGTIRYQHLKMDVGAAVQGRLVRTGSSFEDTASGIGDNVVGFGTDKPVAAVK